MAVVGNGEQFKIKGNSYIGKRYLPMDKIRFNPSELKKIIQTTQAIEGYKPAAMEVVKKIQQLRQQYGIQVSPRK